MQKKTVKSILVKKFSSWVDSIEDDIIRGLVLNNTIITGGAIASLILGEKPKDFDIYFRDKETTKMVAQYYVNLFNKKRGEIKNRIGYMTKAFVLDGAEKEKCIREAEGYDWGSHMLDVDESRIKIIIRSDGVANVNGESIEEPFEDVYDILNPQKTTEQEIYEEIIENADEIPEEKLEDRDDKKYQPIFLSPNAITLSDKIQIVIRFYGLPDEIHENYDFIHCINYWTSWNNELIYNEEALDAIFNRVLIYKGSKYPVCSVIRTRKFLKRGWNINAGQYVKMCFQISELNLHDIGVLEDQLVGVDTAYFMELIYSLRRKMDNDPSFQLSNEYVISVIDKIFG